MSGCLLKTTFWASISSSQELDAKLRVTMQYQNPGNLCGSGWSNLHVWPNAQRYLFVKYWQMGSPGLLARPILLYHIVGAWSNGWLNLQFMPYAHDPVFKKNSQTVVLLCLFFFCKTDSSLSELETMPVPSHSFIRLVWSLNVSQMSPSCLSFSFFSLFWLPRQTYGGNSLGAILGPLK